MNVPCFFWGRAELLDTKKNSTSGQIKNFQNSHMFNHQNETIITIKKSCSKKERKGERGTKCPGAEHDLCDSLFVCIFPFCDRFFMNFEVVCFFSGDMFVVNPGENLTHASHYEVHQTFKQSSEESWLKKAAKEAFTSDSQVFAIQLD